ncbi:MAG TPA: OmpW family outer membrane protein [Caulobacterales bacterium]|nr:OmpW family outer membrane protein [Caulobacterales bacterium]
MKFLVFAATVAIATLIGAPAFAGVEPGDFMVRGRLLGVVPDESAATSIGGSVDISSQAVPEVDFTYFVTKHVGIEVIAAVTPHDVRHTPTNTDLGEVWLLPPTVTAQYHFNPDGKVKPYIGAGVNYTHFYNAKPGALSSVEYKDTWGWALQAGVDYQISDRWYLNADVKKIKIQPDVRFNNGAVTAAVKIDPWVIGLGVGYKF